MKNELSLSSIDIVTTPNNLERPLHVVDKPKVLLIRPPQLFYFGVWPKGPRLGLPIGLLSIATYLRDKGIDVELYDCFVEGDTFSGRYNSIPRNSVFSGNLVNQWIRNFEDGGVAANDIKDKKEMLHFGASWDQLKNDLRRIQPDIVGLTNLFRENTNETIKAAELIREVLPERCDCCWRTQCLSPTRVHIG